MIHPPLFYLALKGWMAIGGDSIFWLRLLPVLISIIAIFPFFKLCRELKLNHLSTLLAFFAVATNGSLIKYAQEVRMYSMLMCLSLFSLWLFVRFANRGAGIAALTAVNLLLISTHYFGWLVISAEVIAAAILYQSSLRRVAAATSINLFLFIPWLAAVLRAAAEGSDVEENIGWMSRPGLWELVTFALNLVEPFYHQMTSTDFAANYVTAVPILALYISAFAIYGLSSRAGTSDGRKDDRVVSISLVLFAAVPVGVAFLASWLSPLSVWGTRHLIIVFIPVALLMGHSVSRLRRAARFTAAAGLIALASVAFIFTVLSEPAEQSWCVVDREARQLAESGEPVQLLTADDLTAYQAWFAVRRAPRVSVGVIKNLPGIREDSGYFLPRGFDGVEVILTLGASDAQTARYFILRSSTVEDHRRNREDYIKYDSLPVQTLAKSGLEASSAIKRNLPGEDVYLFSFR